MKPWTRYSSQCELCIRAVLAEGDANVAHIAKRAGYCIGHVRRAIFDMFKSGRVLRRNPDEGRPGRPEYVYYLGEQ